MTASSWFTQPMKSGLLLQPDGMAPVLTLKTNVPTLFVEAKAGSLDPTRPRGGKTGRLVIEAGRPLPHEPGMMKSRAKLYAQAPEMRVSNGDGFGTSPSVIRKKASWRDSTVTMALVDASKPGSVVEKAACRSIIAPMPTEVMTFERA